MRLLILFIAGFVALSLSPMCPAMDAPATDAPADRLVTLNAEARTANVDLADAKRRFHLGFQALYPSMPFWKVTYGTFSPPAVSPWGMIVNPTTRPAVLPAGVVRRFLNTAVFSSSSNR